MPRYLIDIVTRLMVMAVAIEFIHLSFPSGTALGQIFLFTIAHGNNTTPIRAATGPEV